MIKRWLMVVLAVAIYSTSVSAQQAFVQGSDYDVLAVAVKTTHPDKIVVTEVFWYGCPHCFNFEPHAENWSATLPEGVVFEQVPSLLNLRWTEHARAYYSFKLMGVLDEVHKAFFDAIHLKRQRMGDLETIAAFVAAQGLDEQQFRNHFYSFEVETQIRKSIKKEQRYGHRGVPAVIVNGKYLVSSSKAGSNERMLQIMSFLVAKELAQ